MPGGTAPKIRSLSVGLFLKVLHRTLTAPLVAKLAPPVAPPNENVWLRPCLRGNIADDAIQMDVHKTLYPFDTTKKMPHVTVTITKTRFIGRKTQVY